LDELHLDLARGSEWSERGNAADNRARELPGRGRDGSGGGTLNTGSAAVSVPNGLAIDPAAGRIYWGNSIGTWSISYANLDGSGGGNLNTGAATVKYPGGVAVDPADGRIYWANQETAGPISYAKLDGSGGGNLTITAATGAPFSVAVDRAAGRVYWTMKAISGMTGMNTISYVNINAGGGNHDLNTGAATLKGPVGLAVDDSGGRLYWANQETAGPISYANLNGSGGGTVTGGGNFPSFPVLLEVPVGTGVPAIIGGSETGSTLACSRGSWAADELEAFLFHAPQTFSYRWSRNGTDIAGATQNSVVAASPGDYRCRVTASNHAGSTSQTSAPRSVTVPAPAGDRVYWGNLGADVVSFVNLDGSGGGDINTFGATVNDPQGVAIDMAAGRIYWASPAQNKISYADLNGAGGGDLATNGATINDPVGVAIDPVSRRIYWGNLVGGGISFASLSGSGGGELNTNGATMSSPTGVAVDPASRRIYWSNAIGKISYARLDNTGGGDVNTGAATVNFPVGVAVNPAAGRIYWANTGAAKISYANLDGSGGGDLATGAATVGAAEGIAIDPAAGRIYWANRNPARISFAQLDGSGGGDLPTLTATAAFPEFPALLESPRASGAPTVTGATATGSTLTCSQGSWAADLPSAFLFRAPQTYTYQWTLNGTDISGATQDSVVASAAGAYGCRVTAVNPAGSNSQTSAALTVTAGSVPSGPVLSGVRQSHRTWRAANKLATAARKPRPPVGTRFSYVLNEAARVTFAFSQTLSGRKAAGHCVKQTRRNRHKRACTLTIARGTIAVNGSAGANQLRFYGRVTPRTRLTPGRYAVAITATDTASHRSRPSLLRFTIAR
jgi:DNA-binding beta-propeller fold protein YncE